MATGGVPTSVTLSPSDGFPTLIVEFMFWLKSLRLYVYLTVTALPPPLPSLTEPQGTVVDAVDMAGCAGPAAVVKGKSSVGDTVPAASVATTCNT